MAHLHEWGYVTPKGENQFAKNAKMHVEKAFNEKFLGEMIRDLLLEQAKELDYLLKKEAALEKKIMALNKECPLTQRLMTIPGIGEIIGSTLSCLNMNTYQTSRDFAASLGLVPRQNTTGGNIVLGSITKTGNRYARTMLIQGARCVLMNALKLEKKGIPISDQLMIWGLNLLKRKCFNVTCVGIANKMARIVFALSKDPQASYDPEYGTAGGNIEPSPKTRKPKMGKKAKKASLEALSEPTTESMKKSA